MKNFKIIVVCLLILPQSMVSQNKKLLKAAQKGNVESQLLLGNFYLGRGMNGDKEQAIQWYRQAAEKDNDRGQYMLGYCYENGIGVNRDSIIAVQWYERAIKNHNTEAQSALNKLQNKTVVADEITAKKYMPTSAQTIIPEQPVVKEQAIFHLKDNTIDMEIPITSTEQKNHFAVIIGNEQYMRVSSVPYANNDAKIFAEYCKKTLGLPAKNVKVYENATYGTMIGAVSDIQKIAKAFKGNISVIFYYAGHGIPDEATGDGYLLPIDADGLNIEVCYPLNKLYKQLGEMQARSVTCFMDACFSGAQRGNGMVVAARGVAIKAKSDHPTGNTVVFTAATDKQTAYPYEEKGHGLFTYYLLKKLRETKGDCTLGELGNYVCDEVAKQAVVTNGKEQTPVVLTSVGVSDNWKNLKLR